jgi:spermidine/putrescine transport system substrate-binding protein
LLIWNDYINPALLKQFGEDHHCIVLTQTYDSNQKLHQMMEDPSFEADVVVPSSYYLDTLNRSGLLAPLDHSQLGMICHLDDKFMDRFALNPLLTHGVPYFVGPTGIATTAKLKGGPGLSSWNLMDAAPRISILDDMVEAIGAAVLANGHERITWSGKQLSDARASLERWLGHGVLDGDTYVAKLRNQRLDASQAYPGDVHQMQGGQDDLSFTLPKEGFIITCDMLAVTSMSIHPELAHSLVNYLCEPKVCAENMKWTMYRAPNRTAFENAKSELASGISIQFLEDASLPGQIVAPLAKETYHEIKKIWAGILTSKRN